MTIDASSADSPATELFGLRYDSLSLDEAADRVLDMAGRADPSLVVTPNADHFLRWQRDADFRDAYGESALAVLDGMPLVWIARALGDGKASRVTGIDLFSEVCGRAAERGIPVAIVGGMGDSAERASSALQDAFPSLLVPIAEGPSREQLSDASYLRDLAARTRAEPGLVVALCLGSPKQEVFYRELRRHDPQGVFMGVGAAVDFWSGTVQRAPKWVQDSGLEWMYRLSREPKRLWRRYLVDNIAILRYVAASLGHRDSDQTRSGSWQ